MRVLAIAAGIVFFAGSAVALEPLSEGSFRIIAKLSTSTTAREAQGLYGMGFLNANRSAITFSNTGSDGKSYTLGLTFDKEVSVQCGWFTPDMPQDAVHTLCETRGEDAVRGLLANGKDRNRYLALIGGKLKGVQYEFGGTLVTVSLPDPQATPSSITVAWCPDMTC